MAGHVTGRLAAEGLRQMRMADEIEDDIDWDNFQPDSD